MGLSSLTTVNEAIKFCIFDLKRGQHEGQELDKILFFFPTDLPFSAQLSVIGLSEGLITFTRIFSPEAACEVIEAEEHSHVFYEAEPDIWMVMIVEKSKGSEAIWRIDALRGVLKEVHSLFMMFNGPIRALLDKEPAGGLIRSHLYTFIMDYLSAFQKRSPLDFCCWDFLVGKKLQLPNFRDSLRERGTVQMLTIGREAAIEVQSLVRQIESSASNTPCYSLILFQDLLVSTTLSPEDTINLFTYAVLRLSPRALPSAVSSWSYLRKGNVSSHAATGSISANSGAVLDQFYRSHNSSSAGDPGYNVARPLQPDKWTKGKDGFLVSGIWNTEAGSSAPTIPTIWLQQTGERMYLYVFQHRNLTLILLIPVTSIPNGEQAISMVKQQVLENASLKIDKVEEKLSKGWGGENAYHVSGYRYLLVDGDKNVSRASPPTKVTTLTKESLVALTKLREEVDLEKSRAKWDGPDRDKDLEISIRAKNNAWVIGQVTRGKELYMVLEKANETLLYASDAVENFSNRYCNGSFSLD
ncbi:vacuolar fusion protein CCZ1 homolog B-like isoform X1 [Rhododendron vialii]|uniref:vacuolar fusion protein CCZ1 homolog B-like isoform X1 n=2 Tax=Rhododendron vialii TaxID=182163 RepID=UPI00265DF11E|nr:vacuolar fusion protein CCZ1 homolog B-like isoform X1 [Rhododendron vialii]XP_058182536.1 vacuolar fusion protein CCZ1 homolog B-like isoform X1 [Rhododendron vialii]XP_058182537.1 vacuolar fusion protein CCZ1 homolog B-like isoform X1 [Rhododendron vialii]